MRNKFDFCSNMKPKTNKLIKNNKTMNSSKEPSAKINSTIDSKNQLFSVKSYEMGKNQRRDKSKSPIPERSSSFLNKKGEIIKDVPKSMLNYKIDKEGWQKHFVNGNLSKPSKINKRINEKTTDNDKKDTRTSLKTNVNLKYNQNMKRKIQNVNIDSMSRIKSGIHRETRKKQYNSNQEKEIKEGQNSDKLNYFSNEIVQKNVNQTKNILNSGDDKNNNSNFLLIKGKQLKSLVKNKSKRALNTSVPIIKKQNKGKEVQDNKLNPIDFNLSGFLNEKDTGEKSLLMPSKKHEDVFMIKKELELDQIRDHIKSYFQSDNSIENFKTKLEFYEIEKIIGKGETGKVYLATHKLTCKKVAIKTIEKTTIKNYKTMQRIFNEIDILASLNHENIVQLLEIFENSKYYFFVTEYCEKGDLLKMLSKSGTFKEPQIYIILKDLMNAIEYLHSHSIFHRDIKLDNVLVTDAYQIKICDFGISKKVQENELLTEKCGTPAYLAPEVINQHYYPFHADVK